jgi:hypothetical protein
MVLEVQERELEDLDAALAAYVEGMEARAQAASTREVREELTERAARMERLRQRLEVLREGAQTYA